MYEAFYKFREKPFSLLPDPGFLYLSEKHRLAFAMLEYGLMNQAGFTVLTGEIGSGKTTLIRHLLEKSDQALTMGLVSNTYNSFGELLKWILLAFDLDYRNKDKVELFDTFFEFVVNEYAMNRKVVLIIDEAQNMSESALEELRMVSNINSGKDQLIQIILVGQPELRDRLRRPELTQFAQRIAVDYHLQALGIEETAEYIRHRLALAGGDVNLFDMAACVAIYYYTRGTPRLINVLCDAALVCGFADERSKIDADLVHDVVRDKTLGGIVPVWEYRGERRDVVVDLRAEKKKLP